MKSLLYDTQTKQITYDCSVGKINLPNPSKPVMYSEDTIQYPFECILGIIHIDSFSSCLFFCSETELQGTYNSTSVYRIVKVNYVALTFCLDEDIARSIVNLFESLRFYFTFDKQKEHFLWNLDMLKNFKEWAILPFHNEKVFSSTASLRSPFSPKIKTTSNEKVTFNFDQMMIGHLVCGYFESQVVRDNNKVYSLTIFSKISTKKIGTRLLSRGVDDLGKVSFFVETKFITDTGDSKNEFTILRGSVPVFWSQNDPLKPHKIQIDKDIQKSRLALQNHFKALEAGYGKIVVVDLLGSKKYEYLLSKIYRELCEENSIDYIHFDLNKHTENFESVKSLFYKKLSEFIKKFTKKDNLESINDEVSYSCARDPDCIDSAKDKYSTDVTSFISSKSDVSSSESDYAWDDEEDFVDQISADISNLGIQEELCDIKDLNLTFRVNCMDCLDRTNIGQYIISRFCSNHRLQAMKSMWVRNGNALSHMYTGSNSLKTELSAKGKLTMMGRVNDFVISANRMIQNKFVDHDKQIIIDLILGRKSS